MDASVGIQKRISRGSSLRVSLRTLAPREVVLGRLPSFSMTVNTALNLAASTRRVNAIFRHFHL
jgi:hypothetical protein